MQLRRSLVTAIALLCFTATLHAVVPRSEHPRPDAFRANWATLNGEWQFEIDQEGDGEARGFTSGRDLAGKIIVPFSPESKLSGVHHYGHMHNVWYRRFFELPDGMKGKRVRLHFGAVDYQAWVWMNGQLLGSHVGGSVGFSFEITAFLREGKNELVVRAFDDTASGRQPTGKQTHNVSEGCVYTRTTGIWQPVWIEAVGSSFVEGFNIIPDPARSRVLIEADVNGNDKGLSLTVEAFAGRKSVGKDSCAASRRNNRLVLDLSEKRLWQPGAPFLYDLKFTLSRPGSPDTHQTLDEVESYFGLRTVTIEGRSVLINGRRVFQRLILDQGFYPDGIWTAPSDDELRGDIERAMAAGYNGARLHQKVFEPRFLYWADKLGYLVWGEFPNWGFNYRPENYAKYLNEWTEVLLRDRNHPAIIGWCPFNETPIEAGELQRLIVRETRAIDPTRPVLETSGWSHTLQTAEIRDDHDYNQDPASFKLRWEEFFTGGASLKIPERYTPSGTERRDFGVAFMVSEFGGAVWSPLQGGWGYGAGPRTIEEFYTRYEGLLNALLDNPNMFGFCYTQLTDVEQECNGLYYYDRRPKFDMKRLRSITSRQAAYEREGPSAPVPSEKILNENWQILVGARADGALAKPYYYTLTKPGPDWMKVSFDHGNWQLGEAPFGNELPNVRTRWNSSDIWLRQEFRAETTELDAAALVIFYDEDTEVYVNGRLIWKRSGFATRYEGFVVTDALRGVLKQGRNTLAVHTRQTGGGQYMDLALLIEPRGKHGKSKSPTEKLAATE